MQPIIDHYDLEGTPNNNAGDFDAREARRVFRAIVNNFEDGLEYIEMAIQVMRVTEHADLEEFERNQEILIKNVNNFYTKALKPHRYEYEVFSRVPVASATVSTLSDNMIDKLKEFRVEARGLRREGLNYFPRQEIRNMAINTRRLDRDEHNKRLRQVIRESRRVMVRYNREIIQRDLEENDAVMERYEAASNALFRANASKSFRCHAIWALNRRNIVPQQFERRVLEKEVPDRWESESI